MIRLVSQRRWKLSCKGPKPEVPEGRLHGTAQAEGDGGWRITPLGRWESACLERGFRWRIHKAGREKVIPLPHFEPQEG